MIDLISLMSQSLTYSKMVGSIKSLPVFIGKDLSYLTVFLNPFWSSVYHTKKIIDDSGSWWFKRELSVAQRGPYVVSHFYVFEHDVFNHDELNHISIYDWTVNKGNHINYLILSIFDV